MAAAGFFNNLPPGVWSRKYGAALAWQNQPQRVATVHALNQAKAIDDDEIDRLRKLKQETEAKTRQIRQDLEQFKKDLPSGDLPPGPFLDDIVKVLEELLGIQDWLKKSFTKMESELQTANMRVTVHDATEKELRLQISQLYESANQTAKDHVKETMALVASEDLNLAKSELEESKAREEHLRIQLNSANVALQKSEQAREAIHTAGCEQEQLLQTATAERNRMLTAGNVLYQEHETLKTTYRSAEKDALEKFKKFEAAITALREELMIKEQTWNTRKNQLELTVKRKDAQVAESTQRLDEVIKSKDKVIEQKETAASNLAQENNRYQQTRDKLQSDLNTERAKIEELNAAITGKDGIIEHFETSYDVIKSENAELLAAKREIQQQCLQAELNANTAAGELVAANRKIQNLQIELTRDTEHFQNSTKTSEQRIQELEAELRERNHRTTELENSVQTLKSGHEASILALQNRYTEDASSLEATHKTDMTLLRSRLTVAQDARSKMAEKLGKSQRAEKDAQDEFHIEMNKNTELQTDKEKLQRELDNKELKITEADKQHENDTENIRKLETSSKQQQKELEQLRQEMEALKIQHETDITNKSSENLRYQKNIGKTEALLRSSQAGSHTIVQTLKLALFEVKRLSKDNARNLLRRSEVRRERDDEKAFKAKLASENQTLKGVIAKAESQNHALKEQNTALAKRNTKLMNLNTGHLNHQQTLAQRHGDEMLNMQIEMNQTLNTLRETERQEAEAKEALQFYTNREPEIDRLWKSYKQNRKSLEAAQQRIELQDHAYVELKNESIKSQATASSKHTLLSNRLQTLRDQVQSKVQDHNKDMEAKAAEIAALNKKIEGLVRTKFELEMQNLTNTGLLERRSEALDAIDKRKLTDAARMNDVDLAFDRRRTLLASALGLEPPESVSRSAEWEDLVQNDLEQIQALIDRKTDLETELNDLQKRFTTTVAELRDGYISAQNFSEFHIQALTDYKAKVSEYIQQMKTRSLVKERDQDKIIAHHVAVSKGETPEDPELEYDTHESVIRPLPDI